MRTRRHPYLLETIWMDKYKYDEAEELYYEEQAMLAVIEAARANVVQAVNGDAREDLNEDGLTASQKKDQNGKKRRKRSPKKNSVVSVDFVLMGLRGEHVWCDKYVFEEAENMYQKQLADLAALSSVEKRLPLAPEVLVAPCKSVPRSETVLKGFLGKPKEAGDTLVCSHSAVVACHHVVRDVWVNKLSFDDAECKFIEKPHSCVAPQHLNLLPLKAGTSWNVPTQSTPDEGYSTATPTPATPATPGFATYGAITSPVPIVINLPNSAATRAPNGKPQLYGLQELVSEVWYNKSVYDNAERCFYENMYNGSPTAKEEQSLSISSYPVSKNKKNQKPESAGVGKRQRAKDGQSAGPAAASSPAPVQYFLHHDSEQTWFSKSVFDRAEKHYYELQVNKVMSKIGGQPSYGTSRDLPSPSAAPCSKSKHGTSRDPPPSAAPCSKSKHGTSRDPPSPSAAPCSKSKHGTSQDLPSPSAASCLKSRDHQTSKSSDRQIKAMEISFLAQEKIWFDKCKFDDAERQFYEQQNGPAGVSSCSQEIGASTILQDIARARENIQKSLAGTAAATSAPVTFSASAPVTFSASAPVGDHSDLLNRVANLELENCNLRQVVEDLRLAVSKLESRLTAVEKCPASSQPAANSAPIPQNKPAVSVKVSQPTEEDDDDDIDLFGSDEDDEETVKIREERLRQYAEKKSKKPALIAKSSILLDVKPWDDETDMAKLEECVRSIQMDGLVWGTSKLVPVGYGIKKLQIQCVVEDDKVGTDQLEEEITKFEDYVQSMDIAAFNKI